MSPSDESCLVSPVMLDIEDHVTGDFGVPCRNGSAFAERFEGLVIQNLFPLQSLGLGPFGVPILLIDEHGLVVVSRDLVAVLVPGTVAITLQSRLVDGSTKAISDEVDPLLFRAIGTIQGGETFKTKNW